MIDSAAFLFRFDRLIREVENGDTSRNSFRPWEIELLVDMQGCRLGADRRRVLKRYRKAVHRSLEQGTARPLKLSEYLARSRKERRAPAA
jgi:hypothetical protein